MTAAIRVGITGESGFIGGRLAAAVRGDARFGRTPFVRDWFESPSALTRFAAECDAVVHLAAVSRGEDGSALYDVNLRLTARLADAAAACPTPPAVYLGSTTHIARDTPYHASKRDSAELLRTRLPTAVELLMPNTFGPGARPFWNSVAATFCELAASGREPAEIRDAELKLIGIDELCARILDEIARGGESRTVVIPHRYEIRLPEVWRLLRSWRDGAAPDPGNPFENELFAEFRSCRQPPR